MSEFNLESKLNELDKENTVGAEAVAKAKEEINRKKLEEQAYQVERRLRSAAETTKCALRDLKMARAEDKAQLEYLQKINEVCATFEANGDCDAYDKNVREAKENRRKKMDEARAKIYGEDNSRNW